MDPTTPAPRRLTVLLTPGDRRALYDAALRHIGALPEVAFMSWLVFDFGRSGDGETVEPAGIPGEFAVLLGLNARISTAPFLVWSVPRLVASNAAPALHGEPPLVMCGAAIPRDWTHRNGETGVACTDLPCWGNTTAPGSIRPPTAPILDRLACGTPQP